MNKDGIDVVVLAGGMATRMGPLCARIPKALLPILQTPFAVWQMRELTRSLSNLRRAFFVVRDGTESLFREAAEQSPIPSYTFVEEMPKGTGGAILYAKEKAANLAMPLSDPFLVLNGDVLFEMRAENLIRKAQKFGVAIQGISHDHAGSYGGLKMKDDRLIAFDEAQTGIINAGLYAFCHTTLDQCAGMSSFEAGMVPALIKAGCCGVVMTEGAFIDIGTPANYALADSFIRRFAYEMQARAKG